MKRPAASSWQRGLLLVEAALAAVSIAVGLVFLTRGLSSQLRAIQRLKEQDGLQAAAHTLLAELEGSRLFGHTGPQESDGTVEAGSSTYGWVLTAAPCEALRDAQDNPLAAEVTVALQPAGRPGPSLGFWSIWPIEWTAQ